MKGTNKNVLKKLPGDREVALAWCAKPVQPTLWVRQWVDTGQTVCADVAIIEEKTQELPGGKELAQSDTQSPPLQEPEARLC